MGCGTPVDSGVNTHQNVIMLAISNQTAQLIQLLQTREARINLNASLNYRGDTLLHYACMKDNETLVDYLLKRGVDRSLKNTAGASPASLTANENIRLLLTSTHK